MFKPWQTPARARLMAAVVLLLTPALAPARADDPPAPPVRRTTIERMATARLKATHEDAARIRERRRDLPPIAGLKDFRAIFHAHAEDSAHTGGTRPEMLAEAKKAGVHAIFLSNHHRPPVDFVTDSWRGLRDGVLFQPGSEARGFLLCPTRSILDRMEDPVPALIAATREGGGLVFLSHIEERPDHPMDGLDGLEIYNRHADAKKDRAGLLALTLMLTDPAATARFAEDLANYPDELFAFQVGYPDDYLAKWDRETPARRLVGVAANDCHHNQILIVKKVDDETVLVGTNVDRDDQMMKVSARLRPGIRTLTKDRKPGEILVRVDLDPYHRSFRNVSTHILAPELTEAAVREGLRQGHVYVSHDWICDPTGFQFTYTSKGSTSPAIQGEERPYAQGGRFQARFPAACHVRLIRDGKVVAEGRGEDFSYDVTGPGVYRVEGWHRLDGEDRPWIYSNPIYLRAGAP